MEGTFISGSDLEGENCKLTTIQYTPQYIFREQIGEFSKSIMKKGTLLEKESEKMQQQMMLLAVA